MLINVTTVAFILIILLNQIKILNLIVTFKI